MGAAVLGQGGWEGVLGGAGVRAHAAARVGALLLLLLRWGMCARQRWSRVGGVGWGGVAGRGVTLVLHASLGGWVLRCLAACCRGLG